MSSLKKALEDKNKKINRLLPKSIITYMNKVSEDLKKNHYESKAFNIGQILPDCKLIDSDNNELLLYDLLNNEKTILSFYRGAWCPYCNLELAFYDELIKESEYNIQMLAISPERPDESSKNMDVNDLSFTVLSDINNSFSKQLNLVFKLPKKLKVLYRLMGINLKKSQNNINYELPIPATYIIDKNKVIRKAWINADYTKRAEPDLVLEEYLKVDSNY